MTRGYDCCKAAQKCEPDCKSKKAYAQIKLVFADPNVPPSPTSSGNPYAEVSEYAPHCGVKHAELVKIYTATQQLLPESCIAFKIKVAYDDCYFACGFVPNLQVSTCAPDEHHYNANVRQICSISNNQHAFFRVDLFPNAACYPACTVPTATATVPTDEGVVAFNILAVQGSECKY
jgi:hypothetical protein